MTTERSEELKKKFEEGIKDLKKVKKEELLEFIEMLMNDVSTLNNELQEKNTLISGMEVAEGVADELKADLDKSKAHITSLTDACGILERRFTELHRNYRYLCGAWVVLVIVYIITLIVR
jgi:Mg2+ and Co2+ transporter CorA